MPSTSTLPSELLRTQPAIPRMCASRSTNQRKPTPCTRPRTTNRRASTVFSAISPQETLLVTPLSTCPSASRDVASYVCPQRLRTRQISPFRCVHADLFAFVDERGHLYHKSGFCFRRLCHTRCRGALQAGLGLDHRELDNLRQLDSNRFSVKKLHLDLQIRNQVIHGLTQRVRGEMRLLEIRRVHEVVRITVVVQILHLDFIHRDLLDRIGRTETVLKHCARAQVAQLGLDEGAQIPWRAVFHAEHRV